MSKLPFLLLAGILSLLASACRTGGVSPVYDVVVVAGRAVSSDHGANSALRVQASCMGMGQAAGVAAALAATRRLDPRDIPIDLIKKRLTDIGHIVPRQ